MNEKQQVKNVILITVDSLRADFLRLYGGPVAAPHIESFATESVVYPNAFSTSAHTKQSFPGILASNYPTSGGVNKFGKRSSIAYYLGKVGFETAGFHSNPLLARSKGYAQGFDTFIDFLESTQKDDGATNQGKHIPSTKTFSPLKSLYRVCPQLYEILKNAHHTFQRKRKDVGLAYELGEVINTHVLNWLKSQRGHFFLWIHYMDTHFPYATSENVSSPNQRREALALTKKMTQNPKKLTETELSRLKDLYAREITYVDECIGELHDFLQEINVWDNAFIVLTSDHGEAFMEHGALFHGDYLYNEFVRVPLIIKNPNWQAQTISQPVSLIDLAPTIVRQAGINIPKTFEGRPLTPEPIAGGVIVEMAHRSFEDKEPELAAVIDGKWKLIVNSIVKKNELYDLSIDIEEKHNLIDENPEIAQRLLQRLQKHIERDCPNRFPDDEFLSQEQKNMYEQETEEIKKKLRALGYFDEE